MSAAQAYDEGSPIDAFVFGLLIAAGVMVLFRRKIDWGQFFKRNKCIWLYFLYCTISIFWSDNSFLTFKRLIKELGNLVMIMIIITEACPFEALGIILKRLAFLIVPLSILFINYYPSLGRAYDIAGNQMSTGVCNQKNLLGKSCLIIGIYFIWYYFVKQKDNFKILTKENMLNYILIVMLIWLLYKAQSSTSSTCLVVALCLLFMSRIKSISRKPASIIALSISVAALFAVLEATLHLSNFIIIDILGRDPTLTSRTYIWQILMNKVTNPLIGSGYMSFWSGDRLIVLWEEIGANIIQAHSGYMEQYLNLGYIGVAFIGLIMLSGLLKVCKQLYMNYQLAVFRFCFIVISILYNYTEASFYGTNNMWMMLLIAVIEIPAPLALKKYTP